MESKGCCPHCSYKFHGHESLKGEYNPKAGDVAFCVGCGAFLTFTATGMATIDIRTLDEKTRKELKDIEHAWLLTKKLKESGLIPEKENKAFTLQCCSCLCVLGVSRNNYQEEPIFCLKCGKIELERENEN